MGYLKYPSTLTPYLSDTAKVAILNKMVQKLNALGGKPPHQGFAYEATAEVLFPLVEATKKKAEAMASYNINDPNDPKMKQYYDAAKKAQGGRWEIPQVPS